MRHHLLAGSRGCHSENMACFAQEPLQCGDYVMEGPHQYLEIPLKSAGN